MRESLIESKVRKYALERDYLVYKFVSPGTNGVPDRIFITPQGQVFFVEFKNEKGKLSAQQEYEIQRLRDHNCAVFVIDSFEQGKNLVDLLAD